MKKYIRFVLAALCVTIAAFFTLSVGAGSNSMTLHAVHLGDTVGDCVIIESDGKYLVQDLGSADSYPYVKAYLDKLGAENIRIYLSHFHPDHTGSIAPEGGFEKILADFNVEKIYIPDEEIYSSNGLFAEAMSNSYHYLSNRLSQGGYSEDILIRLKTGSTFTFGSISAEVLGPVHPEKYILSDFKDRSTQGGDDKQHSYENNSSLVTMFTCGKTKYLTMGDAGDFQSALLVGEYGSRLDADIFELSHHARPEGACDEAILSCVTPSYSFAQNCGEHYALKTDSSGISHLISETARKNAGKYGIVCTTGEQGTNFIISVENDNISAYIGEKAEKNRLSGIFSLKGGDGVHYKEEYFCLDENSKPFSGIKTVSGKAYLFVNGKRIQAEYIHDPKDKTTEVFYPFVSFGDKKRAFTMDGEMLIGFRKPYEKNTDRYKSAKNDLYYFDKNGFIINGDKNFSTLYKIGGKYYIISDTGKVFTGATKVFTLADGTTNSRYFNSDGSMITGWYEKDGKKYYLQTSGSNVGFRTVGFKKIGSYYYYFYNAGNMASGKWVEMTASGKKGSRYFDKSGKMLTGWQTISGSKYYLQPSGAQQGFRLTGFQKIGSYYYYFSDSGKLTVSKTVTIGSYKYSFDKNGKMTTKIPATTIKSVKYSKSVTTVTIEKRTDVKGYIIYRATSKGGKYTKIATIKASATTYKDKKAPSGKKCYYKVYTYRTIGSYTVMSKASAAVRAK